MHSVGSGPEGADATKSHKFFEGIDWKKLSNKEIIAPYKPTIDDELGLNNFSEEYTAMGAVGRRCAATPNHESLYPGTNTH